MVICLERGAYLYITQLMPLLLTVSCFSKIQVGLPFWYRLTRVVPLNGCVCVLFLIQKCIWSLGPYNGSRLCVHCTPFVPFSVPLHMPFFLWHSANSNKAVKAEHCFICLRLHDLSSVLWHCWLGARKSIWPVKIEWWGVGLVICLERGADCLHMVQLMPSLAPFKSRQVLPFWYRLFQIVLEKRPLNGCSRSSSSRSTYSWVCVWCDCTQSGASHGDTDWQRVWRYSSTQQERLEWRHHESRPGRQRRFVNRLSVSDVCVCVSCCTWCSEGLQDNEPLSFSISVCIILAAWLFQLPAHWSETLSWNSAGTWRSGWVWVGECFFWYCPTQLVLDKLLLNSCVWWRSVQTLLYVYSCLFDTSASSMLEVLNRMCCIKLAGKFSKTVWGLESFGIWCKRSLKPFEFHYFIVAVSTVWKFCNQYWTIVCTTDSNEATRAMYMWLVIPSLCC